MTEKQGRSIDISFNLTCYSLPGYSEKQPELRLPSTLSHDSLLRSSNQKTVKHAGELV